MSIELIKNKAFISFFWLQFLGALNDNLYKNALVILIAFHSISIFGMQSQVLVTFSFGLFILPFFLFSALAGQVADKYSKSSLIQYIKFCEILIMLSAIVGLYFQYFPFLLLVLFLMGMQSAFFGPIKYSILPALVNNIFNRKQQINQSRQGLLVQANGLIGMGTFTAILIGTILGGILSSKQFLVTNILPASLVFISLIGWLFSFFLPNLNAADRQVKIQWNLWKESKRVIFHAKSNQSIYRAILLISWFWFVGASILSQLPNWTTSVLYADEYVVTTLLTCFSLGVGLGAVSCNQLHNFMSYSKIFRNASIGISLSLILFVLTSLFYNHFLAVQLSFSYWQVTLLLIYFCILSLGFSGGLFIVPLYYFIQDFSDSAILSRIIAANNIFNAFFMVVSSIILSILLLLGVALPIIFVFLSLFNLLVVYLIIDKDRKDLGKQQHFFDLG
jgi:acyl-[acyl-carrier-protein]-phospholipid O-acyltransferase / long-chain-fatty-acid--[acyl-carrier-protein] ligase